MLPCASADIAQRLAVSPSRHLRFAPLGLLPSVFDPALRFGRSRARQVPSGKTRQRYNKKSHLSIVLGRNFQKKCDFCDFRTDYGLIHAIFADYRSKTRPRCFAVRCATLCFCLRVAPVLIALRVRQQRWGHRSVISVKCDLVKTIVVAALRNFSFTSSNCYYIFEYQLFIYIY